MPEVPVRKRRASAPGERIMLGRTLSVADHSDLLARAAAGRHWLRLDPAAVAAGYNRAGFLVEHDLAGHPLFRLEPLLQLCRRAPPSAIKYRFGVVPIDAHFDSSIATFNRNLTRADAIDRLEETRAYIAVYNPEKDDEYRPAIEGLLGELAAAIEPRGGRMNWFSSYVFISTTGSVTPYHMDREMNFLLQIRGTKTVQLWDPRDDRVMRPEERDRLFSTGRDTRAPYHDGLPSLARTFALRPGLGVHHPFIAPHVVTTGPELSVSLAITFRTPQSDRWSDAHALNHRLLEWGWHPGPVGRHAALDIAKAATLRTLRAAKSALRRGSATPVSASGE
jgi:hypothetical protein